MVGQQEVEFGLDGWICELSPNVWIYPHRIAEIMFEIWHTLCCPNLSLIPKGSHRTFCRVCVQTLGMNFQCSKLLEVYGMT